MKFVTLILAAVVAIFAVDVGAASLATQHVATHGWLYYTLAGGGLVFGAALSATDLTLADWAKRLDPDGKVPVIVELLAQMNEVLIDMAWKEGNLPTGDRTTVRTGLPTVFWRLLNQGVPSSKSTTAQIDEQCGMLEGYSEVDKDLAMLNGNTSAFRLSEASSFLEAMNQEFVRVLFYGNGGVNPEQFTGLSTRYSLSTAGNGANVLKAGGAGADNASMWLVVWGPNTISGIFPKGSKAGLIHEDKGEVLLQSAGGVAGNKMVALIDRWQWKGGISLKDWRYVVRICNIDVSDLIANAGAQAALLTLMAKAVHRPPSLQVGRPVFYANRTVLEFLDIQTTAAVSVGAGITFANVDGQRKYEFRGIPIRTVDQLLETEALVA
ncbi:MAG TPA: hypothetical protein VKR23_15925 [Gaiellaceae bacterium]|nr:hypothetical protein [Gaiellaceae bacterium]